MNISLGRKLCVLLFMFSPIALKAQDRIYVNEYLNIGVGARGLAMGGAIASSVSDVYAGYWNPAGLMNISTDFQIGAKHAEYFAGIFNYNYGGLALPIDNKKRVIGLSFVRFATDDIPYTLDYIRPDGSFDESKLKSISAGDYAVLLSFAQALLPPKPEKKFSLNAGANAKIIYRHIGRMGSAWGIGIDIGLQAKYGERWSFGLMMKDITTTYTAWRFALSQRERNIFRQTGNEIPVKSYEVMRPRFNIGVGHQFFKPEKDIQILAELGFDITTDGQRNTVWANKTLSFDPRLGLEANYKEAIFVRAGVSNFYTAGDVADTSDIQKTIVYQPSIGVGFKIKNLIVDYAFTSLQMQDNPLMSHIISLRLDIQSLKKTLQKEED